MSRHDTLLVKDRVQRRKHLDDVRHHTEMVRKLASQGAPSFMIEVQRDLAHAARLRSWGWTGPVPSRALGGAA